MRKALPQLLVLVLLGSLSAASAADATLTVVFGNNGEPLPDPLHGKFYVYEPEKRNSYVAWGHAGRPAVFPEGTYDVVIRYQNDLIREERVIEEREFRGRVVEEVQFFLPVASLTVNVTSGGQPIPVHAGNFSIHRAGQRGKPLTARRPGEKVTLSPGRYDIEVTYRDLRGLQSTWMTEFWVDGERVESVDIGLPTARLRMTLLENGLSMPADRGRWRLTEPGRRSTVVAEAASGEALDVPAGFYDIGLVFLTERGRDERWLAGVEVRGEEHKQIEIVAAETTTLEVTITDRGSPLRNAWFTVHPPGRGTALAGGRSGERIEVQPGTYDIRCTYRDGGMRAEKWLRGREVSGKARFDVNLAIRPATLRIVPGRERGRNVERPAGVMVILDSSFAMRDEMGGRSRLDVARQALLDAAPILDGAANVGVRAFGIAPRSQQDCRDSTLLVAPGPLDRRQLTTTLDLIRPAGFAPVGFSLERTRGDLDRESRNTVVLITGNVDGCEGDPCTATARLLRERYAERVHVLGLGVDRTAEASLSCAGSYRRVGSRSQLRSALRDIFRAAVQPGGGSVSVFLPDSGEWVVSGALGETLKLSAGTYDILIHQGDRTHSWSDFRVQGDTQATAAPRPD